MNINPTLITALAPLGLPVRQTVYIPDPPEAPMPAQYIVFITYYNALADFSSGTAIREDLSGQLSVFSRSDYKDLVEQAVTLMRTAGFRVQLGRENYEKETGYHQQIIEWQWFEVLYEGGAT